MGKMFQKVLFIIISSFVYVCVTIPLKINAFETIIGYFAMLIILYIYNKIEGDANEQRRI